MRDSNIPEKNVDNFISHRTEQQQTTIKTEKRKDLGKIVSFFQLSLVQMDIYDQANIIEIIKDINIFYVLPMYIVEKYGPTK